MDEILQPPIRRLVERDPTLDGYPVSPNGPYMVYEDEIPALDAARSMRSLGITPPPPPAPVARTPEVAPEERPASVPLPPPPPLTTITAIDDHADWIQTEDEFGDTYWHRGISVTYEETYVCPTSESSQVVKGEVEASKSSVSLAVWNPRDGTQYNERAMVMLEELLAAAGARATLVEIDTRATDADSDAAVAISTAADGVVVVGSEGCAQSCEPWAEAMRRGVVALHAVGAPTLAFGHGHALVASAFRGARIAKLRGGPVTDARELDFNALGARLMGVEHGAAPLNLLHCHGECVPRMPPGAQSLSEADPLGTPFVLFAAYWANRSAALAFRGECDGAAGPHVLTIQASLLYSTASGAAVLAAALDADRATLGDAYAELGLAASKAAPLADAATVFRQALACLWPATVASPTGP